MRVLFIVLLVLFFSMGCAGNKYYRDNHGVLKTNHRDNSGVNTGTLSP